MGQARKRGTPAERIDKAEERAAMIARAIAQRGYADGLVWLVIERARSVPQLGPDKAIMKTAKGDTVFAPDDRDWRGVIQADLPDWVQQPDIIGQLMDGVQVNAAPEAGGQWYRGRIQKASKH